MQLPDWLDNLIFNTLGAHYHPVYADMTNIDDNREKTLNYLERISHEVMRKRIVYSKNILNKTLTVLPIKAKFLFSILVVEQAEKL